MSEEVTTPKNTKSLVPTVYYDMLYLKFMGLDYKQIAERTGYSYDWVKHLFAKGGVLYDLHTQWLETAKKNSMEDSLEMMWGHLPDIVRSRIVAAKGFGAPANTAAEIILRYTLGNPDKPMIQNNIQINNETQITGFQYIIPNDPNNKTDVETTSGISST